MEEKKKSDSTILGCMSSLLIFGSIIALCMFMFWLSLTIFGVKL